MTVEIHQRAGRKLECCKNPMPHKPYLDAECMSKSRKELVQARQVKYRKERLEKMRLGQNACRKLQRASFGQAAKRKAKPPLNEGLIACRIKNIAAPEGDAP